MEDIEKEGWVKHWEEVTNQIPEGVNPHAYRLGFLKAKSLYEPAAKEPTDLTKTEPMEERDNITIICGWLGGNTPRAIAARKFMDGLLEEIHKLSHPAEEQEYPLMCRECGKLKTDDGNLICLCPKEPTDLTKICPLPNECVSPNCGCEQKSYSVEEFRDKIDQWRELENQGSAPKSEPITAEEVLRKQEVHQINIGGVIYEMVKMHQAIKAMEEYANQKK